MNQNETNFIGYEYKTISAKKKNESLIVDGYENFGWELETSHPSPHQVGTIELEFKRNRKIKNKTELTRLQRQFDGLLANIDELKRSEVVMPSAVAYIIGVIGTAFMAGSVFALTSFGNVFLMIVLCVPGFIGWVIPYWVYVKLNRQKREATSPYIDEAYDEIYTTLKTANQLLAV